MEENTLEIKITGDDTGAGDSPASGVNSPIYDVDEGKKPVSEVPRYQKQFDELLARSSIGLLAFSETIEHVENLLRSYRDEIISQVSNSGLTPAGATSGLQPGPPAGQTSNQPANPLPPSAPPASQTPAGQPLGNPAGQTPAPAPPPPTVPPTVPPTAQTPPGQPAGQPGGTGGAQSSQMDDLLRMARVMLYTSSVSGFGGRGTSASSLANAGVNIAATGVLGQGAAAMAGGPVGLLAVIGAKIADIAVDKIADGYRSLQKDMRLGGDFAKGVIGNDIYSPVMKGAEHAAESLEQIPIVGKIFAEQLRTATTTVSVFKETIGAATARAKELQAYDSRVAQSFANQDVSRILADINEADRLGEQYGRIIDSQTDIMSDIKEILLPLKEIVVTDIAGTMEVLKNVLQILKPFVLNSAETMATLNDVVSGIVEKTTGGFDAVVGILEGILGVAIAVNGEANRKRMEDMAKKGGLAMNQLFEMRDNRLGVPAVNQRENVEGRGLEIPLLLGAR